ncbi:MAG: rubrerythrin family protein [Candidatus Omnitrophica bacterium]|nr:rubrerythrin family protein [Candidatus Omnitrophota bacterium]
MHKMTQNNLLNAFSGESQAHMKYLIFSEMAEKENKTNVSRLFKAIAYAEEIHAKNHLKALGLIKNTLENLDTAIQGETFEVDEMYPVYNSDAQLQGEKEAEKSTRYALEAEKIHAKMYKKAKDAVSKNEDIDLGDIYICPICGFTQEGELPNYCPICGAEKKIFKRF